MIKCFRFIVLIILFTLNIAKGEGDLERARLNVSSNVISLEFNILNNEKIYLLSIDQENYQIELDFTQSENLKEYKILWPRYSNNDQSHYYYTGKINIPLSIAATDETKPVKLHIKLKYILCSHNQCFPVTQELKSIIEVSNSLGTSINLLSIICIAFVAGLILNFMPCVLPVVSLKILSLVNMQRNNNLRISCLMIILGIITSFIFISFISIFIKSSGKYFNLGGNFQKPEFIIIIALILIIFISASLDKIAINLPAGFNNFLIRCHFRNQYLGHFFSGAISTILSTSCNAPFLGVAVTYALLNNNLINFTIFLSIAFGFSIPYICLLIHPNLVAIMPKPGLWMLKIKQILAFVLCLTLIWLITIIYSQIGIRPTLGLFFLLILFKFILENNSKILRYGWIKICCLLVLFSSSIYLPQIAYKEDLAYQTSINKLWIEFEESKIKEYNNDGLIVLVDITASWCITCKFNKLLVWDRERTSTLLQKYKVIAMRGDYTAYDQKIDNYLASENVNAIPYNKIYFPQSPSRSEYFVILPPLLSYHDLESAITQYTQSMK